MVSIAAFIIALNINTFVNAGDIVPGGFTGLALLIQECFRKFLNIQIPFSVLLYTLNAVPAIVCFRVVGKRFTIFSCITVFLTGILTDCMPPMFIEYIKVHDTLLSAVFGGLINAVAMSICLFADASSGGTDFIAVSISEKYGRDVWNYIFVANCVILIFAASLFSLEKALYSIIFQFTTTMTLGSLYKGYQKKTLFIITSKPDEIYPLIRNITSHDATSFKGVGMFLNSEKTMLYSVVAANEDERLIAAIKQVDPDVFINILKTDHIQGRFYRQPKD
jgi:uncharacterized membrane-anchored protein YitT (DUF2179 family)